MIENKIDGIVYRLNERRSVDFLSRYGKAFYVFDENDSGNISFGVGTEKERYFVKIAGLKTVFTRVSEDTVVQNLIRAVQVYENIRHLSLIPLIDHYALDDLHIAVFKWVDGDCLLDHWNFEKYAKDKSLVIPRERFRSLPLSKRLNAFETLMSFMKTVSECGYAAIDMYDGSLIYDFQHDRLTFCDIDLFEKAPYINSMGKMWGSSRFMAPEMYILGAVVDEITNVYTLGALSFLFFGDERSRSFESWNAGRSLYEIAERATKGERDKRYGSVAEFMASWHSALSL